MALIEREAAVEALEKSAEHYSHIDDCTEHTIRQCISTIKKVPTIDAAPVVHGRWVGGGSDKYCSECGVDFNIYACQADVFNHCPNCGARMDEARDVRIKDFDDIMASIKATPHCDAATALMIANNAPTIDAIHAAGGCYCRECKWFGTAKTGGGWCNEVMARPMPYDGFCSYGEPREARDDG